jgi:hypothetical protein
MHECAVPYYQIGSASELVPCDVVGHAFLCSRPQAPEECTESIATGDNGHSFREVLPPALYVNDWKHGKHDGEQRY